MMSNTSMYGVVLWTDADDRKAVIWCEDQGNLAFYTPGDMNAFDGVCLDAGDLIQFDMREEQNLRFARNPQLVGESQYPDIAQRLRPARPVQTRRPARPEGSNVVSLDVYFDPRRQAISA